MDVSSRSSVVISRDNAVGSIQDDVQEEDAGKQEAVNNSSKEAVELDGRREFFRLRSKWSWAILIWISALVGFNMFLALGIGWGSLSFHTYEWFITAVTVETFFQIVGLGYVAAKFVFSRG